MHNAFLSMLYPECRIGKVVASHAAVARSIPSRLGCTDLFDARGTQGVLPMRVWVRPVNWIYRL